MMLLDVLLLLFIKVHLKRHIFNKIITVFLHNIILFFVFNYDIL